MMSAADPTTEPSSAHWDSELVSSAQPAAGTTNGSAGGGEADGGLGVSVASFMWMYVCPVILLVGVVGNCLTIAVMRRKRLRGGTVAIYLILMAVADSCFLVVGIIPEWLEALDVVIFKELHPATCKLEKFIGYTSGDTAIWLLVVFTFDRFVAVCFPLRKSEVCTTKRAWILGSSCLLLGVVKNVHVFWTRGAEYTTVGGDVLLRSHCGRPTPAYDHFESFIRPWIAFAVVSAIPFFLICFFNIGIVKTLLCMPVGPTSPGSGTTRAATKYSQTTLMCISVSVLFLVTITPSMVIVIGRPYWDTDKHNPNFMYRTAKGINNALVFMNHSLNFFLYCLTGRRFREQLVVMFKSSSCCEMDRDGFPNSAAQKASLYLKTFHKFSQEFISTSQRTEENTAGTSVSTGLTNVTTTGLSRQSTKSTVCNKTRIKADKSKESFKSLDSESSVSIPVVEEGVEVVVDTGGGGGRRCGGDGASGMSAGTNARHAPPGVESGKQKPNAPASSYPSTHSSGATPPTAAPDPGKGGEGAEECRPRGVTKTETRCSVYLDEDGVQQVGLGRGVENGENGDALKDVSKNHQTSPTEPDSCDTDGLSKNTRGEERPNSTDAEDREQQPHSSDVHDRDRPLSGKDQASSANMPSRHLPNSKDAQGRDRPSASCIRDRAHNLPHGSPDLPKPVRNPLDDTVGAGSGVGEGVMPPTDEIQDAGAAGHPDNVFRHPRCRSRELEASCDSGAPRGEVRNQRVTYRGAVDVGSKRGGKPV